MTSLRQLELEKRIIKLKAADLN